MNNMPYKLLMIALLLSSCAELPKNPSMHDFGLLNPSYNSSMQQLKVAAPSWLADNRLRYRLLYADPTRVRFYAYDQWLATPAELFEQYLQSSGLSSEAAVSVKLLQFEQQFANPKQAKVILHFSVELITDSAGKAPARIFSLEQPCSPDANGAVSGLNALVRQAGLELQQWLRTTAALNLRPSVNGHF